MTPFAFFLVGYVTTSNLVLQQWAKKMGPEACKTEWNTKSGLNLVHFVTQDCIYLKIEPTPNFLHQNRRISWL